MRKLMLLTGLVTDIEVLIFTTLVLTCSITAAGGVLVGVVTNVELLIFTTFIVRLI